MRKARERPRVKAVPRTMGKRAGKESVGEGFPAPGGFGVGLSTVNSDAGIVPVVLVGAGFCCWRQRGQILRWLVEEVGLGSGGEQRERRGKISGGWP